MLRQTTSSCFFVSEILPARNFLSLQVLYLDSHSYFRVVSSHALEKQAVHSLMLHRVISEDIAPFACVEINSRLLWVFVTTFRDWSKHSRQFLIQSDVKPESIVTRSRKFSRASLQ